MMPPENMSPRELWSAMAEMPRPYRVVDFPRKDAEGKPIGQVAIRVLLQGEQIRAGLDAEKLVRAELPDAVADDNIGYTTAYANAVSVQQLFLACRDVSDAEKRAFPSAKWMRDHLTTDEVAVLYSQYLEVAGSIGPIITSLTDAEEKAWIAKLTEGGSADAIPFGSWAVLKRLLATSVDQIRSLRTQLASVGSPLDSTGAKPSEADDLGESDASEGLD